MNMSNDELALKLEHLAIDIKQEKFGEREHFDSCGFIQEMEKITRSATTDWRISYVYIPNIKGDEIIVAGLISPLISPAEKEEQNCGNCLFYEKVGGFCRINPPLTIDRETWEAIWPVVFMSDWCGKYTNEVSENPGSHDHTEYFKNREVKNPAG